MSRRIALISEHASPLAVLGGVDSGGQNVYVAQVARHLAALGDEVDVFTRRTDPEQATVVEHSRGVRVIHVPAGPPAAVPCGTWCARRAAGSPASTCVPIIRPG